MCVLVCGHCGVCRRISNSPIADRTVTTTATVIRCRSLSSVAVAALDFPPHTHSHNYKFMCSQIPTRKHTKSHTHTRTHLSTHTHCPRRENLVRCSTLIRVKPKISCHRRWTSSLFGATLTFCRATASTSF